MRKLLFLSVAVLVACSATGCNCFRNCCGGCGNLFGSLCAPRQPMYAAAPAPCAPMAAMAPMAAAAPCCPQPAPVCCPQPAPQVVCCPQPAPVCCPQQVECCEGQTVGMPVMEAPCCN